MTRAMTSIAFTAAPRAAVECAIRAGCAIDAEAFAALRRRMVLEHCKWDPQVGDVSTIAPFPLILSAAAWRELWTAADALCHETMAIERRLLERPALLTLLGLPRRLRRLFERTGAAQLTPAAARVMRFDFHFAADGWRVSEVNSDVPGGFTESSVLPRLMKLYADSDTSACSTAGDPLSAFVRRIAPVARSERAPVALLAAAGFMEDLQVVSVLARELRKLDVDAHLAQPTHLRWIDGRAHLETSWYAGPLACVVRFYQGEWLARLKRNADWRPLFLGGRTPVSNPGVSILTESKRLPLVWDGLDLPLPAWRRYLPDTRGPRDAPWRRDDGWLLKAAYCNTGDAVLRVASMPHRKRRATMLDVALHPGQWVAQRRFETRPIDTPHGPRFACVGVYTIDGVACGAYGRRARAEVIVNAAVDAAVLVARDGAGDGGRCGR
jgi:glutathionylspermidine synthase